MNKLKYILKNYSYFLISLLIYLIIITLLSYINIFNYKTINIISFIYINILFLITGFKLGKNSTNRGYLSGLIIGISNILLILFLAIIFRSFPELKSIIYFLILLLSSTIGGMMGINFKRKD